ncbi:hypothetical protein FKM82_013941 [Ascaphus truei]
MVGLSFANNAVCLSQGGSCEMLSFGIYDQCVAVDPYTVPSTPTAGFLLCLSDDIALCVLRGKGTFIQHLSVSILMPTVKVNQIGQWVICCEWFIKGIKHFQ